MTNRQTEQPISGHRPTPAEKRASMRRRNLMATNTATNTGTLKPWQQQQERERKAWRTLRKLWQQPRARREK